MVLRIVQRCEYLAVCGAVTLGFGYHNGFVMFPPRATPVRADSVRVLYILRPDPGREIEFQIRQFRHPKRVQRWVATT